MIEKIYALRRRGPRISLGELQQHVAEVRSAAHAAAIESTQDESHFIRTA